MIRQLIFERRKSNSFLCLEGPPLLPPGWVYLGQHGRFEDVVAVVEVEVIIVHPHLTWDVVRVSRWWGSAIMSRSPNPCVAQLLACHWSVVIIQGCDWLMLLTMWAVSPATSALTVPPTGSSRRGCPGSRCRLPSRSRHTAAALTAPVKGLLATSSSPDLVKLKQSVYLLWAFRFRRY